MGHTCPRLSRPMGAAIAVEGADEAVPFTLKVRRGEA
jgi:hypothetical protein